MFCYGFCNGFARSIHKEYQRWFPNGVVPDLRVFPRAFNKLRETGAGASKCFYCERAVQQNFKEVEEIIQSVEEIIQSNYKHKKNVCTI